MTDKNKEVEQVKEPSVNSILETARMERERMENLLPKLQEERRKLEELQARELLGGKSDFSKSLQPVEISPKDYAQHALKGKILGKID